MKTLDVDRLVGLDRIGEAYCGRCSLKPVCGSMGAHGMEFGRACRQYRETIIRKEGKI